MYMCKTYDCIDVETHSTHQGRIQEFGEGAGVQQKLIGN